MLKWFSSLYLHLHSIVVTTALVLSTYTSFATTIHVPDDYPTIQAGLNIATEGDTVLVAAGTYYENITWPAVNGIKLIGSGEEDCIVDGNQQDNVIRFEGDQGWMVDSTTFVAGFTIQNGRAWQTNPYIYGGGIYCSFSSPTLMNISISNNTAISSGGGIYCDFSSPCLIDVTITGNSAPSGGGIGCVGNSNPGLTDVLLNDNTANSSGGGMYCFSSCPCLSNVIITGNMVGFHGGGVFCDDSSPILENVTISHNSAINIDYSNGGGIYCRENSNPSFSNTMIKNNSAGQCGGGIYCRESSSLNLEYVTIEDNSVGGYGGGIYCRQSFNVDLANVTIRNNSARFAGGIYCWSSTLSFAEENRCNIYSNSISNNRGYGADIYSIDCNHIDVALDSFTVLIPTSYYASPVDSFTFDILNFLDELIDTDVYVAVNGDDSNSGTTPDSPFQTIYHALSLLDNNNTIHLAAGRYSPSTTGECFPIHWSNSINLSGSGIGATTLDAENTGGVIKFESVSDVTIEGLTITNGSTEYGGGLCFIDSNPSVVNVAVTNCSADQGGGIYCNNSSPQLQSVMISNNSGSSYAYSLGGGLYCEDSYPCLTNVKIESNASPYNGGGIYCIHSSPILENVAISNNVATNHGGGIFCGASYPSLENVTISNNVATNHGGGIYCMWEACPGLENCIMWGDQPQEVSFYSMFGWNALTISCSNIEGGEANIETNGNGVVYWAENNIDADPLFCDPENNDYRLQLESPCRTDICDFMGYTGETCDGEDVPDVRAYGNTPLPQTIELSQNYPNPFNPSTTIEFSLPHSQDVQLTVYNIKGQRVATLVDGICAEGINRVTFDTNVGAGLRPLTSGIYIYRLVSGDDIVTRKMIIVR